jgi:sortase (surface protein transpeptidase)
VALIAACGQPAHRPSAHHHQSSPTPAVATATPSPGPHVPAQLVIPKINVNATVEQVGVDQYNNMAVPSKSTNVAWYKFGPMPGQAGDAVIDGHLDWYNGPAVFWSLSKLQAGDEIDIIGQDGAKLQFQVSDNQSVPYTSHPAGLFAASGSPRLSLITCAGSWDKQKKIYSQRLIVNANYIGQV